MNESADHRESRAVYLAARYLLALEPVLLAALGSLIVVYRIGISNYARFWGLLSVWFLGFFHVGLLRQRIWHAEDERAPFELAWRAGVVLAGAALVLLWTAMR